MCQYSLDSHYVGTMLEKRNLPMDLMNEILNSLFKDLLTAAKGRYTPSTIHRSGQIVGPLGESLDVVFDSQVIGHALNRHIIATKM